MMKQELDRTDSTVQIVEVVDQIQKSSADQRVQLEGYQIHPGEKPRMEPSQRQVLELVSQAEAFQMDFRNPQCWQLSFVGVLIMGIGEINHQWVSSVKNERNMMSIMHMYREKNRQIAWKLEDHDLKKNFGIFVTYLVLLECFQTERTQGPQMLEPELLVGQMRVLERQRLLHCRSGNVSTNTLVKQNNDETNKDVASKVASYLEQRQKLEPRVRGLRQSLYSRVWD